MIKKLLKKLNFKTVNILITIALVGGGIYAINKESFPFLYFFIVSLLWLTCTVIGSFNILWNYFLNAVNHVHTDTNNVAITFDDGPHPVFTPQVLALLKKHNAKATFFCIGKNAAQYPDLVKQIVNNGHSIGNHSYNHANNFGFLNSKKVVTEIQKTDKILQEITGKKVKTFRPPFGVTNPNIAKAIRHTQHQVMGWNVRSLDTVIQSENKIFKRITKKLNAGDIILLHDSSLKSVLVVERLLLFLKKRELSSVTVEELLQK